MEEEEGKLKDQEDKPKEREGKRRLREEDKQMADEDKLKLVGKLIVAESIVLVGIEMVQCMAVRNMEKEKVVLSSEVLEVHTVVLMAQTRGDVGSAHRKKTLYVLALFININESVTQYC